MSSSSSSSSKSSNNDGNTGKAQGTFKFTFDMPPPVEIEQNIQQDNSRIEELLEKIYDQAINSRPIEPKIEKASSSSSSSQPKQPRKRRKKKKPKKKKSDENIEKVAQSSISPNIIDLGDDNDDNNDNDDEKYDENDFEDIESIMHDGFFPLYSFEPDQDFEYCIRVINNIEEEIKSKSYNDEPKKEKHDRIANLIKNPDFLFDMLVDSKHISTGHCFESYTQSQWWSTMNIKEIANKKKEYNSKDYDGNIFGSWERMDISSSDEYLEKYMMKEIFIGKSIRSKNTRNMVLQGFIHSKILSDKYKTTGDIYIKSYEPVSTTQKSNEIMLNTSRFIDYVVIILYNMLLTNNESKQTKTEKYRRISLLRTSINMQKNFKLLSPGLDSTTSSYDRSIYDRRPYGIVHNCLMVNRLCSLPGSPASSFIDSVLNTQKYEMISSKRVAFQYISLFGTLCDIDMGRVNILHLDSEKLDDVIDKLNGKESIHISMTNIIRDNYTTWESNVPTVMQYHALMQQMFSFFGQRFLKKESLLIKEMITMNSIEIPIDEIMEKMKENFISPVIVYAHDNEYVQDSNRIEREMIEYGLLSFPTEKIGTMGSKWLLSPDEVYYGCCQDPVPMFLGKDEDYENFALPTNNFSTFDVYDRRNDEMNPLSKEIISEHTIAKIVTFKSYHKLRYNNKKMEENKQYIIDPINRRKDNISVNENNILNSIRNVFSEVENECCKGNEEGYRMLYSRNVPLVSIVEEKDNKGFQSNISDIVCPIVFDNTQSIFKSTRQKQRNLGKDKDFFKISKESKDTDLLLRYWNNILDRDLGTPFKSNYLQANLIPETIYSVYSGSEISERMRTNIYMSTTSDSNDMKLEYKGLQITRTNRFGTFIKNRTKRVPEIYSDASIGELIGNTNESVMKQLLEQGIISRNLGGSYIYRSVNEYIINKVEPILNNVCDKYRAIFDKNMSYNDNPNVKEYEFNLGGNRKFDMRIVNHYKRQSNTLHPTSLIGHNDLTDTYTLSYNRQLFHGEHVHQWARDIFQYSFWHTQQYVHEQKVDIDEDLENADKLLYEFGCKLPLLKKYDMENRVSSLHQDNGSIFLGRQQTIFDIEKPFTNSWDFSNCEHTIDELRSDYIHMLSLIFFSPELLLSSNSSDGETNNQYLSLLSRLRSVDYFTTSKWSRVWCYLEDVDCSNYNITTRKEKESLKVIHLQTSSSIASSSSSSSSPKYSRNLENMIGRVSPKHLFLSPSTGKYHENEFPTKDLISYVDSNLFKLGLIPLSTKLMMNKDTQIMIDSLVVKSKIDNNDNHEYKHLDTSLFDILHEIFTNKSVIHRDDVRDYINGDETFKKDLLDIVNDPMNVIKISEDAYIRRTIYNTCEYGRRIRPSRQINILNKSKYEIHQTILYDDVMVNIKGEISNNDSTSIIKSQMKRALTHVMNYLMIKICLVDFDDDETYIDMLRLLEMDKDILNGELIGRRLLFDTCKSFAISKNEMNVNHPFLGIIMRNSSLVKYIMNEKGNEIKIHRVTRVLFDIPRILDWSGYKNLNTNPFVAPYCSTNKSIVSNISNLFIKLSERTHPIEQNKLNRWTHFMPSSICLGNHNVEKLLHFYNAFSSESSEIYKFRTAKNKDDDVYDDDNSDGDDDYYSSILKNDLYSEREIAKLGDSSDDDDDDDSDSSIASSSTSSSIPRSLSNASIISIQKIEKNPLVEYFGDIEKDKGKKFILDRIEKIFRSYLINQREKIEEMILENSLHKDFILNVYDKFSKDIINQMFSNDYIEAINDHESIFSSSNYDDKVIMINEYREKWTRNVLDFWEIIRRTIPINGYFSDLQNMVDDLDYFRRREQLYFRTNSSYPAYISRSSKYNNPNDLVKIEINNGIGRDNRSLSTATDVWDNVIFFSPGSKNIGGYINGEGIENDIVTDSFSVVCYNLNRRKYIGHRVLLMPYQMSETFKEFITIKTNKNVEYTDYKSIYKMRRPNLTSLEKKYLSTSAINEIKESLRYKTENVKLLEFNTLRRKSKITKIKKRIIKDFDDQTRENFDKNLDFISSKFYDLFLHNNLDSDESGKSIIDLCSKSVITTKSKKERVNRCDKIFETSSLREIAKNVESMLKKTPEDKKRDIGRVRINVKESIKIGMIVNDYEDDDDDHSNQNLINESMKSFATQSLHSSEYLSLFPVLLRLPGMNMISFFSNIDNFDNKSIIYDQYIKYIEYITNLQRSNERIRRSIHKYVERDKSDKSIQKVQPKESIANIYDIEIKKSFGKGGMSDYCWMIDLCGIPNRIGRDMPFTRFKKSLNKNIPVESEYYNSCSSSSSSYK